MNTLSFDVLDFCDYNKYGKSYEKAVIQLLNLLKEASRENFAKHMEEFCQKYTMLPEFWLFWAKNIYIPPGEKRFNAHEELKNLAFKGFKHFKTEELLRACNVFYLRKKLRVNKWIHLPFSERSVNVTDILRAPHKMLQYYFIICMEDADRAIDAKIQKDFKSSIQLYKRLVNEKNNEKWFELLKKCDDKECIEQNAEFRIGKDPSDINLWKLKLEYLKQNNFEGMLSLYGRYCRLFLDDVIMRRRYLNEVNSFVSKSRVKWWMDVIDIQYMVKTDKSAVTVINNILLNELKTKKIFLSNDLHSCLKTFEEWATNFENQRLMSHLIQCINIPSTLSKPRYKFHIPLQQSFAFPFYMMKMILNTQNFIVLQNLFMTCKYFYSKRPILIVHKLTVNPYEKSQRRYNQQSLYLGEEMVNSVNFRNVCVTNAIQFICENVYTFSIVLSKIRIFTAKYLDIVHQILSTEEWELITANGRIDKCNLKFCRIFKNRINVIIPFEKVLDYLPNVSYLSVKPCAEDELSFYTVHTASIFTSLKRRKKFEYFDIEGMLGLFDGDTVGTFILENAAPHSNFRFIFCSDTAREYKTSFFSSVEKRLSKWVPEFSKPTLNKYWHFKRNPDMYV